MNLCLKAKAGKVSVASQIRPKTGEWLALTMEQCSDLLLSLFGKLVFDQCPITLRTAVTRSAQARHNPGALTMVTRTDSFSAGEGKFPHHILTFLRCGNQTPRHIGLCVGCWLLSGQRREFCYFPGCILGVVFRMPMTASCLYFLKPKGYLESRGTSRASSPSILSTQQRRKWLHSVLCNKPTVD